MIPSIKPMYIDDMDNIKRFIEFQFRVKSFRNNFWNALKELIDYPLIKDYLSLEAAL
jgi:hypothetical protein